MAFITICYIDGGPVVYEGTLSEEDKRKIEALYPGREIRWEIKRVE